MIDDELPSELVQRLHQLRISKGLKIQQMAETCDLPKSSLESYMRMSGAKRPGIDALIAIADGMGVGLDWLVGRSNEKNLSDEDKQKYSLAVFGIVLELLRDIEKAQAGNETPVIQNGMIGGRSLEDFAVRTMLHFTSRTALFEARDHAADSDAMLNLDAILEAIAERKPATK